MLYVNVPLPKPVIDKMDKIIANEVNGFRSRPDFILQHMRPVITKFEEKEEARKNNGFSNNY